MIEELDMAEANTCITEERLKILIKSIFAEEFQKQEKNINIISGNFEITMTDLSSFPHLAGDTRI